MLYNLTHSKTCESHTSPTAIMMTCGVKPIPAVLDNHPPSKRINQLHEIIYKSQSQQVSHQKAWQRNIMVQEIRRMLNG